MGKKVICLTALFLCILGTVAFVKALPEETESKEAAGTVTAKETEKSEEIKEDNPQNVLIFTDQGKKTEEVANVIEDKIEAVAIDEKKLEEEELRLLISNAKLVLIGGEDGNARFYETIRDLLAMNEMKEKRVTLFMIGEDESAMEEMKNKIEAEHENLSLLPCFFLSWDEELREDELSRMNGWLTTAFTY